MFQSISVSEATLTAHELTILVNEFTESKSSTQFTQEQHFMLRNLTP
jgi:hypothetical protein